MSKATNRAKEAAAYAAADPDPIMEKVYEKISKAVEDADLKSMDFGETRTISFSGLFDDINFDEEEDEE
tara:strand:- start:50 stop:256 length:207 start_codon:yes stop_codon:yes gene_type:complete